MTLLILLYIIGYIVCFGKIWGSLHWEYPNFAEVNYKHNIKYAAKMAIASWFGLILWLLTDDFKNKYKFI